MAEIHQEILTISVSKLARAGESQTKLIDEALLPQIEALVQEMLQDDKLIVEVTPYE
jgi:glucan phosphoethanolaminetransferase (alkaline phosphatase superfamily)